jgi:hypothetical protein
MSSAAPLPAFPLRQALVCGGIATLVDVAIGAHWLPSVFHGALFNPDSYMRLARLDDILVAHAPIDVVARDGSGAGTVLYWSHLLDTLLLVLAVPLAPFLGEHEALRWAGVLLGPLSAGLLGMALGWAAAPLSEPRWRWTAALSGALAIPIIGYSLPGVVHHHTLVALAGVMCAGWAGRSGFAGARAGRRLGAWACFGLWLSPEVMPIVLMSLGAVGLGWLLHPDEPRWGSTLATGTTTFAVLVGLTLAVDPPHAGPLASEMDRLSVTWLAMGLLGAAVGLSFRLIDRQAVSPVPRALVGGTIAVIAATIWLAMFPAALRGTGGLVSGADPHAFFAGIAEMLPVRSLPDAIIFLLLGTFGALVAMTLAIRRRSLEFAYVAACVLLLVMAAATHRRFAIYGACAGAIGVPVAITLIGNRLKTRRPIWSTSARLALLLLLLITPFAVLRLAARSSEPGADIAGACSIQAVARELRPFAGQIVLADVNDTPELLYRTQLQTVGSLYHSNAGAYLRLRDAWRTQQLDRVPPEVTATGASLVLFCRQAARPMVRDLPPDTLWDRLSRNDPPTWLHEFPLGPQSGFRLFSLRSLRQCVPW